jgi:LuxR family glucitol operon transcriptional activator
LLDLPDCPFNAIVWASSKTSQLTAQEIVRIEGAIRDSLGMLEKIASELAGAVKIRDALEEVISYLGEFHILLILDNLETVLDERVRQFLGKLPAGSKVLITSRIGVGAFEYPVTLQAMDEPEILGAADLVKTSNKNLAGYCRRMKNNPGYLKWFVSAVQAGKRPEEVLAKPDVFLDFCMSNVYDYLSASSQALIRAMLCVPGKHSQAELAYLSSMEHQELQRSLQQLLTTNMVVMSSVPRGSSYESQYDLSELARSYLSKHHPARPDEYKTITCRRPLLSR